MAESLDEMSRVGAGHCASWMATPSVRTLAQEDLDRFARKGFEGGPNIAQGGQANGVKVRRIMQITSDLARPTQRALRILDLGCGEGVYAIEAALHGAEVVAIDARTERMQHGIACAARHGLNNLTFHQRDIRGVEPESFGTFDVVYLLGILYHFDVPEVFGVLEQVFRLCAGTLVIDTLVALDAESGSVEASNAESGHVQAQNVAATVEWKGQRYFGRRYREHEDGDSPEVRRARVLRSIDNTFSFRFTRDSLIMALQAIGFTSLYECRVPFEPGKAAERITLVAKKGEPVELSTYPWVNGKSEREIADFLGHGGAPRHG